MRIARDDKYIYVDGEKVAVIIAKPYSHTVLTNFIEFLDKGDDAECDHPEMVECEHCGHLTSTSGD